jgi:hypothetical protein
LRLPLRPCSWRAAAKELDHGPDDRWHGPLQICMEVKRSIERLEREERDADATPAKAEE